MLNPMGKNTDLFFNIVREFDSERWQTVNKMRTRLKEIEPLKGSSEYENEYKKLNEIVKNFKARETETRQKLLKLLEDMTINNNARGYEPPTEKELAQVNALKMLDHVTVEQLERSAKGINNPVLLNVLNEISHKNGYTKEFYGEDIDRVIIDRSLQHAKSEITDYCNNITTKASRATAKFMLEHYGTQIGETDRKPIKTKQDCFRDLFGIFIDTKTGEEFLKAVDGEGANNG